MEGYDARALVVGEALGLQPRPAVFAPVAHQQAFRMLQIFGQANFNLCARFAGFKVDVQQKRGFHAAAAIQRQPGLDFLQIGSSFFRFRLQNVHGQGALLEILLFRMDDAHHAVQGRVHAIHGIRGRVV